MASRGRPRKFTKAELAKRINAYFRRQDRDKKPYTICGLALALDTNRQTLCRWGSERHEFGELIRTAKTRVEAFAESRLFGPNPAGAIFWLKNFGWSDRQQFEHSGGFTMTRADAEELRESYIRKLQKSTQPTSGPGENNSP